jgi:hypothetical protein
MNTHRMTSDAWYAAGREEFLEASPQSVVAQLSHAATSQGWFVEEAQVEEWETSVDILKQELPPPLCDGVAILRDCLAEAGVSEVSDIVLEYNLRRRGLRIDAVLLAPGVIFVIEFKRSKFTAADRDQVTNYCVNLVEFHSETQRLTNEDHFIVVPMLVLTDGRLTGSRDLGGAFFEEPWSAILRKPVEADGESLAATLAQVFQMRRSERRPARDAWVQSLFRPSSSILDAAVSLYGDHTVSAIDDHANSVGRIEACVEEIFSNIQDAQQSGRNRIVFLSGAPGSGKTLVGLRLAFDPRLRSDAVFVTGNAPLVDVLTKALTQSYRGLTANGGRTLSGYPRGTEQVVARNAVFKIVKAHNFLGERGSHTAASDGRVVIFDEAQRTYEKGRLVLGRRLPEHEADLVLESLEKSYGAGVVVVALIGQNQAINVGERGPSAWFEAASRRGWEYAVADETFMLNEFGSLRTWAKNPLRLPLGVGHLSESLRFYRNKSVEEWASLILEDRPDAARALAGELEAQGVSFSLTRDLAVARDWVRSRRVGEERIGLIASGQARRLAADGLFVQLKPPIADWMLAPSGDLRSSNALETVQNQYQIQGLEVDYAVVCWDADLRRGKEKWQSFKISGANWAVDRAIDVAKNSYRVLLTRARKGMIFFVPEGDQSGEDLTRMPTIYDGIVEYLVACGVRLVS